MNKREEELYLSHIEKMEEGESFWATEKERECYKKICNALDGDTLVVFDVFLDLYHERQDKIARELFLRGIEEGKKEKHR